MSKWIGLRADDAKDRSRLGQTVIRWPTSTCGSQPPIGCMPDKPFAVDVLHQKADLVAVAGEHHAQLACGLRHGDHVAVHVGA